MNRREFLWASTATMFSALAAGALGLPRWVIPDELEDWARGDPQRKDGPAPLPEITAVVDIMVPADPEIPGDFKGSDYGADWILAATLGSAGQLLAVTFLNNYAKQTAGKKFIQCTPEEQMTALKQWIVERDNYNATFNEMLTGILTISVIGTYEPEDHTQQMAVFEEMGWYDPDDPDGTMRVPCEGYPDAKMFPVHLKKGFQL